MAIRSDQIVLDLIRSGQADTQADLCRLTGTSRSTMACLVKRLRERRLIQEVGPRPVGRGKPATILRFDPGGYILGLDIDGTHAVMGLMDFGGAILTEDSVELRRGKGCDDLLRLCRSRLHALLKKTGVALSQVRALGLSVNGRMTSEGVLEFSTVLPWRNVPVAALAKRIFGLDVHVSDGRQRAVAQCRRGGETASRAVLCFNVADGVSAHLVLNGELFTGGTGRAGEIGHVVFDVDGPRCGCGRRGCLEALISGPAIRRRVLMDARGARSTFEVPKALAHLAQHKTAVDVVSLLVELAGKGGSPYAQSVLDDTVEYAARGLAMASACFGPDRILIDGYVFRERPSLLARLGERASRYVSQVNPIPCAPESSPLGEQARLVSLVTLVADRLAPAVAEPT